MTGALVAATSDLDSIDIGAGGAVTVGLKILIALFLFGIALDTRPADLLVAARRPAVIAVALITQFVVIPGLSVLLIPLLDLPVSVALGLLLVACCPAGNLSNVLAYRARADVALSVTLTAVSNAAAAAATPIALVAWGSLLPETATLLDAVDLSRGSVLAEVVLLIATPFAAGMTVAARRPAFARRARRYVEPLTLGLLLVVLVGGVAANISTIIAFTGVIGVAVVAQNLMSLTVGRLTATACRLNLSAARAMTLEMGVRNTGLGLVLALSFFPSAAGVAVTVALWGLWDVATGFALASLWRRRSGEPDAPEPGLPTTPPAGRR